MERRTKLGDLLLQLTLDVGPALSERDVGVEVGSAGGEVSRGRGGAEADQVRLGKRRCAQTDTRALAPQAVQDEVLVGGCLEEARSRHGG